MKKIIILIFSISSLFCYASQAISASNWDSFLLNTDKDSFEKLKGDISNGNNVCRNEEIPNSVQFNKLTVIIKKGNQSALRAGLLISKCIGVGDVEDLYRSAGLFFEIQPKVFLQIVNESAIADRELGYMVTMFPLELVDDIEGKIAAVNNRIAILNRITDVSLINIKKILFAFLEKEKNKLEKIKVRNPNES